MRELNHQHETRTPAGALGKLNCGVIDRGLHLTPFLCTLQQKTLVTPSISELQSIGVGSCGSLDARDLGGKEAARIGRGRRPRLLPRRHVQSAEVRPTKGARCGAFDWQSHPMQLFPCTRAQGHQRKDGAALVCECHEVRAAPDTFRHGRFDLACHPGLGI